MTQDHFFGSIKIFFFVLWFSRTFSGLREVFTHPSIRVKEIRTISLIQKWFCITFGELFRFFREPSSLGSPEKTALEPLFYLLKLTTALRNKMVETRSLEDKLSDEWDVEVRMITEFVLKPMSTEGYMKLQGKNMCLVPQWYCLTFSSYTLWNYRTKKRSE